MEHSEYDIKTINYGNFWLDQWIKNEESTKQSIISSLPIRFCLQDVYKLLVKLGELPVFWNNKESDLIKEAVGMAKEWLPDGTDNKLESIAMCILVLENLAEKRLKVTTGI